MASKNGTILNPPKDASLRADASTPAFATVACMISICHSRAGAGGNPVHIGSIHLLEAHYDIRTVQELLGHANVATTMIYTHVLNRMGERIPAVCCGIGERIKKETKVVVRWKIRCRLLQGSSTGQGSPSRARPICKIWRGIAKGPMTPMTYEDNHESC